MKWECVIIVLEHCNCRALGDIALKYYFDLMMPWIIHDDVKKRKQFPHYWPFVRGIHRLPVNSPHKGQWRGALMFSLICAQINSRVNNREAGDLRRHRAHYDVNVMIFVCYSGFMFHVCFSTFGTRGPEFLCVYRLVRYHEYADLGCYSLIQFSHIIDTLRSEENDNYFADDILKWVFIDENYSMSI